MIQDKPNGLMIKIKNMIKNLSEYRNRWTPKYYLLSNEVIFNISNRQEADNCGVQVVDVTKSDNELGADASTKAPTIVIKFSDMDPMYFPLQYLIADGDKVSNNKFVSAHPSDTTYFQKFCNPILNEISSYIKANKTYDALFNLLPAWLTTPNNTDNISVNDFIKGKLKIIEDGGKKLEYVKFYEGGTGTTFNILLEAQLRDIYVNYFKNSTLQYTENLASKLMNYKLTASSISKINELAFEAIDEQSTDESSHKTSDWLIEVGGADMPVITYPNDNNFTQDLNPGDQPQPIVP